MKMSMTTAAVTRLLAGGWEDFEESGPFQKSPKPGYMFVKFNSIRFGQAVDQFVVHYCWNGIPMVQAVAPVRTGMGPQIELNRLEGRIELFLHNEMPGGDVQVRK